MPGGNYTTGFHRLLADLDGDRDVDYEDLAIFHTLFETPQWYLDLDGDGDVDADDREVLLGRIGLSV